jgi:hypothetical protein
MAKMNTLAISASTISKINAILAAVLIQLQNPQPMQ